MNIKNVQIVLVLILLLGAFLRIYGLGDESFWVDESATVDASQQDSYLTVLGNIYAYNTATPEYFGGEGGTGGAMPLYYFGTYHWTKLFGMSEFKIRLLSMLFGTFSIYLIFIVGRLFFNTNIGLLSAFLLSINYYHIYYAQEARTYSFLIFLTLLSVYLFANALRENKIKHWIGYTLISVILIYTHYLSFFVLIFQYLYVLFFWKSYKRYLKNILYSGIGIFILYLPWVPVLIKQILGVGYPYADLYRPTLYKLGYVFVQINSWISPDLQTRIALRNFDFASISFHGLILIISVLSITLILGLAFLFGVFRDKKLHFSNVWNKTKIFLILWFMVPIIVPYILSVIFPSTSLVGFVQYVMFATPAYLILASKGIAESQKHLRAILLILLTLLSIFPFYAYYTQFNKQQWREAAIYLDASEQPYEIILINKPVTVLAFSYYHSLENVNAVNGIDDAKTLIEGKDSYWLLYASEKFSDPEHKIRKYLDSVSTVDDQIEFTGIKMFHYVRTSPEE